MVTMPEISRFFGIVVRMYFDDHAPPHIHVEYQGNKAIFNFGGVMSHGTLGSKTAMRLVREWIEIHNVELRINWKLAQNGRELRAISPLE